ncbi:MAG: murein biosynthesis integral membrane protein MurJ [Candidatus Berkelbacteria bacterium]|nr:murein biosynthesis integral membrane protein MurJ [Candidatus Berkelbacteria bacterium]MCR4307277.1 murein biosynthesis integral membrane protein MurJ [Candidatus Berkelbacteria bacterium]
MSPIRRISSLFWGSHNLKQAVGILFVTVLISNVLGLARNVIIANRVGLTYGTIGPLDSYYAAFVLPDLFYNFLIVGALATAVLPLLVKIDTDGDDNEFWRTFNILISTGFTVIVGAMIVLYVAMPYVLPLIVTGFDASTMKTTVELARVLLLSPLFFTISQLSSSALQAKRHFTTPAIAPIIYNIAIICGALLIPQYGLSVLVAGVIVGASAHFLVQLPMLFRLGWRFSFTLGFGHDKVRHVMKVMIPRAIALTGNQMLLLAFYHLGSRLAQGSISIYRLTDDLQTAPVLLLANTLAMAVLPDFARHIARDDHAEFKELIGKTIRLIIFIFVPVTIFLLIFSRPIINLYISVGHSISPLETEWAVRTFRYFILSLPFQGSILVLARSYFARSDTVRPTIFSLISIAVAWISAVWLVRLTDLGPAALALAFSIGSTINALLLWFSLGLPFSVLWKDSESRQNFLAIFFGGVFAGAVMFVSYKVFTALSPMLLDGPSSQNLFVIFASLFCGLVTYMLWAKLFNLEQWQLIRTTHHSTEK